LRLVHRRATVEVRFLNAIIFTVRTSIARHPTRYV
jgi:hypothetical protein